MSDDFSCLVAQKNAIKNMLNFHKNDEKDDDYVKEPSWKILIYDNVGANIIFLLFTVKELRELGVTLQMPITMEDRKCVEHTDVIYFVTPSSANIDFVSNDMKKGLYDHYHISFISQLSRTNLEKLAQYTFEYNCSVKVHEIYDEYINFMSFEKNYFVTPPMNLSNHFYYINSPRTKNEEMDLLCENMVDTLFCVLASLGTIPIIRSQKNNAAEMIANKLNKRLQDSIKDSKGGLFSWNTLKRINNNILQRPLLIIVDRSVDLVTPIRHTWTYQALLHDLYNINTNQVVLKQGGVDKKYQLKSSDRFWSNHKNEFFPDIADSIEKEVSLYKENETRLSSLKANNDLDLNEYDNGNSKLTNALDSLPQLLDQKKCLEIHTNIATHLLDVVKDRKTDKFYELESKIIADMTTDETIKSFISDSENGNMEDRVRLALVKLFTAYENYEDLHENFIKYLQDYPEISYIFRFIDKWRKLNSITTSGNDMSGYSNMNRSSMDSSTSLSSAYQYGQMFSKYIPKSPKSLVKGVKKLVMGNNQLPLTKIVSSLMNAKSIQETSEFTYIDPKFSNAQSTNVSNETMKNGFNFAIVYIVGGGCYLEYLDLLDFQSKGNLNDSKCVMYGCSEQLNSKMFLKQMIEVGKIM